MLNKPATARKKIRVHMTLFPPTDGITWFDGTVPQAEKLIEAVPQVLGHKVLQNAGQERFRMLISDGKFLNR